MKWSHKLGLTASTLTLAAGVTASVLAATPASAATTTTKQHAAVSANLPKPGVVSPKTDTDIEGDYYWNGDGFTGTLDIDYQYDGTVDAVLYDSGKTEYLYGAWSQNSNELTLTRDLVDASGNTYYQYYTYFLGGAPFDSYSAMFGGYYTTTETGTLERGSYLDSASFD